MFAMRLLCGSYLFIDSMFYDKYGCIRMLFWICYLLCVFLDGRLAGMGECLIAVSMTDVCDRRGWELRFILISLDI